MTARVSDGGREGQEWTGDRGVYRREQDGTGGRGTGEPHSFPRKSPSGFPSQANHIAAALVSRSLKYRCEEVMDCQRVRSE